METSSGWFYISYNSWQNSVWNGCTNGSAEAEGESLLVIPTPGRPSYRLGSALENRNKQWLSTINDITSWREDPKRKKSMAMLILQLRSLYDVGLWHVSCYPSNDHQRPTHSTAVLLLLVHLLLWWVVWRTQTQQEFLKRQGLFPGQEHGRTPRRNKNDPTPDKTERHKLNTLGNETQV